MAKQTTQAALNTVDMFGDKKRRGRIPSGVAKTNAQR